MSKADRRHELMKDKVSLDNPDDFKDDKKICDNCGGELRDKIIGDVCVKCNKVFEAKE